MYSNLLNYFIDCVKNEARESIYIEGRKNGQITDKVFVLNDGNGGQQIEQFFFSKGEFAESEAFILSLTTDLQNFLKTRSLKFTSEHLYLTLKFLKTDSYRQSSNFVDLIPVYFVELSYEITGNQVSFAIVDYEPYFNFGLFDSLPYDERLTEEEKFAIREDILNVEQWDSKVAVFEGNFPKTFLENLTFSPVLFIGDIPKFYEYVTKEIESIRKYYSQDIDKTALKYFLAQKDNIADLQAIPSNAGENYLEIYELNREQEQAVQQALNTPFTVITGPPGTGKSQVVLNLLANLSYANKTALLASKNNKAVNTILEKLSKIEDHYYPFVRLGNRREKSQGKERLLANLNKPCPNNLSEELTGTAGIHDKIAKCYENFDAAMAKFHEYYQRVNALEDVHQELIGYKEIHPRQKPVLEFLEGGKKEGTANFTGLISVIDHLEASAEELLALFKDTRAKREKLTSNFRQVVDNNLHEIALPDSQVQLDLHELRRDLETALNKDLSWVTRFLQRWFGGLSPKRLFKRFRRILAGQSESIQKVLLDDLSDVNPQNLLLSVQKLLAMNAYAAARKELLEKKDKFFKGTLESTLNQFDQSFPGSKSRIAVSLKEQLSGKTFDQSLEIIEDFFQSLKGFLVLLGKIGDRQEKINEVQNEMVSLQANFRTSSELETLKQQLVFLSQKLFSAKNSERVDSNKASLVQRVKDYFDKWKDQELSALFQDLRDHLHIWVTTNLSTIYNIPNRPAIFDYVIIDEASQNDLVSIVPLLFRAKRAVIIGDPNQLSHITRLREDKVNQIAKKHGISGQALVDLHYQKNSAFDLARRRYVAMNKKEPIILNNHYRSYPDIIRFSNTIVDSYNLFPKSYIDSGVENLGIQMGIHWQDVKGVFNPNKTNNEEAIAIVDFLKSIPSENRSKISIGIVTPFSNQAKLIHDKLSAAGFHRPGMPEIIASTVHKFQGDERDLILYSPVIAPNMLPKRVGTLNWADSQINLLNVAITRARSSFMIFGHLEFCRGQGGLHQELVHYVDSINVTEKTTFDGDHSGTEKCFYQRLKSEGFEFEYQKSIGNDRYYLDFVVKVNDRYFNIELDGRQHRKTRSQDAVRDEFVRKQGYEVLRFSNEYVRGNLDVIIGSLRKVV